MNEVNENKDSYMCPPERMFVNSLFNYLDYSYEALLACIDDKLYNDIHVELVELRNTVNGISEKDGTPIFSPSFTRFVNRREFLSCKKTPEYCMFQCYDRIINALNPSIKNRLKISVRSTDKLLNEDELLTLDNLENYIMQLEQKQYGTISLRNLQRLITINNQHYNSKQKLFIEYLIKNIYSASLINDNKLKFLCNNWKKILFCDSKTMGSKIFFDTELEKEINKIFATISCLSCDENDELGDKLLEIFSILIVSHRNGEIRYSPNQICRDVRASNDSSDNKDSFKYDAKLSTHILYFIRWIPLIPDDCVEIELLEAISNVIEAIRSRLYDNFYDYVNEALLITDDSINIFIGSTKWNDKYKEKMKNLRKLLMDALYRDSFIKALIEECYTGKN